MTGTVTWVKGRLLRGVAIGSAVIMLGGSAPGPRPVEPSVPAPGPTATVTVHGRPDSFGATRDAGAVPSGQSLATRPVPGFGFPAGLQASRLTLAGDGTLLIAGTGQRLNLDEVTAGRMAIGAYAPETAAYTRIDLRTSTGADRMVDRAGRPVAPSVADLEPVAGGTAVVFTARPAAPDPTGRDGGRWPILGVLSTVDGRWTVAGGEGWTNQWTTVELPAACGDTGSTRCGLDQIAGLPRSRDLIVTATGGLLAVRLTGPDPGGRFAAEVTGSYRYPQVRRPGTDEVLDVQPWQLRADPTGAPGDERFAVTLRVHHRDGTEAPSVLQEFRYDAGGGTIVPVSAPFVAGDRDPGSKAFYGYGATLYDSAGNLWAARLDALRGGSLAIYANRGGARAPGGAACPYDPRRPMASYTSTAAADRTGGRIWGQSCPPDYDLLQGRWLLGAQSLIEDPATHDVVALLLTGALLPVRPSGSGDAMTFRIGNLVDVGRKLLPSAPDAWTDHRPGAVDARHRLWFTATQGDDRRAEVQLDQWLYAVELGDLFAPRPVELPDTPGRSVVIQAEQTVTSATTRRRAVSNARTVEVDSDAYFIPCADWPPNVGCGYDGNPGNDFALADDTHYGHLDGTIEFRIRVGRAGTFRLTYRATALPPTTDARIECTAGGRTTVTSIPGGPWRTVTEPDPVILPAGEQTVRLSVPPGGGGWYLNSLTLQRA